MPPPGNLALSPRDLLLYHFHFRHATAMGHHLPSGPSLLHTAAKQNSSELAQHPAALPGCAKPSPACISYPAHHITPIPGTQAMSTLALPHFLSLLECTPPQPPTADFCSSVRFLPQAHYGPKDCPKLYATASLYPHPAPVALDPCACPHTTCNYWESEANLFIIAVCC